MKIFIRCGKQIVWQAVFFIFSNFYYLNLFIIRCGERIVWQAAHRSGKPTLSSTALGRRRLSVHNDADGLHNIGDNDADGKGDGHDDEDGRDDV